MVYALRRLDFSKKRNFSPPTSGQFAFIRVNDIFSQNYQNNQNSNTISESRTKPIFDVSANNINTSRATLYTGKPKISQRVANALKATHSRGAVQTRANISPNILRRNSRPSYISRNFQGGASSMRSFLKNHKNFDQKSLINSKLINSNPQNLIFQ